MPDAGQNIVVALTLALAEGRCGAEGSVANTLRIGAAMAEYGLSTKTIFQLAYVTGSFTSALRILDGGMPVEYILAMGETR